MSVRRAIRHRRGGHQRGIWLGKQWIPNFHFTRLRIKKSTRFVQHRHRGASMRVSQVIRELSMSAEEEST